MTRLNWKAAILYPMLLALPAAAADLSVYRGFAFGANVDAVAKQAGVKPADVETVHERPALIQEMTWQVRPLGAPEKAPDSVREGVLSFLNGQLYRIVVTYDRYRVEGMTAEDMIAAISLTYGTPSKPNVQIPYHSNYDENAPVLARWEDSTYSYNLVRTGDKASFAMVLFSKVMQPIAQTSIVEAIRLEALAAPQRAKEAQQKRDEEDRLALEKSRLANKPNFKP